MRWCDRRCRGAPAPSSCRAADTPPACASSRDVPLLRPSLPLRSERPDPKRSRQQRPGRVRVDILTSGTTDSDMQLHKRELFAFGFLSMPLAMGGLPLALYVTPYYGGE